MTPDDDLSYEDVRYDEVSGTLIVDTEIPTSDGLVYDVTSALPQHEPAVQLGCAIEVEPVEFERDRAETQAKLEEVTQSLATETESLQRLTDELDELKKYYTGDELGGHRSDAPPRESRGTEGSGGDPGGEITGGGA